MQAVSVSWVVLLPVLAVTGTAVAALITDLWTLGTSPDRSRMGWVGIAGLLLTAAVAYALWGVEDSTLSDAITLDRFGMFFTILICLTSALTILLSLGYLHDTEITTGDYYSLMLFSTAGMVLMATATDLLVLFISLELMSIPAYALAGMARSDMRSNEAALKYFLLGAFASAILLFGIALIYGATGSMNLALIGDRIAVEGGLERILVSGGMALLLVGFGFKVAAVPFHGWAPDVYEGAPTSVTAFMAVGIKTAAFAAFMRIFMGTLGPWVADWSGVFAVLAILTMTVGNVTAIVQNNVKRILAYSSIAHAGYLLVGMVVGGTAGGSAMLFYLVTYAVMTIGAFAVIIALGRDGKPNTMLDDFSGAGLRNPFLGMAMVIFMLSLAGLPPFGGFFGKFYLFSAAVEAGHINLAILGVLNSIISLYYYVAILVRMYMVEEGDDTAPIALRPYVFATVVLTLVATVALGIMPGNILDAARSSVAILG